MKKSKFFDGVNEIYFIGAGGVFMSALIKHCLLASKKVSGSDKTYNEYVKEIEKSGVKIHIGHNGNNIKSADAVVYTSAVGEDNPEIKKARDLKIPIFKRSEFLALILSDFENVVAVSGCHGKTTTSAMITHALDFAGKCPTAFIGGSDYKFGNYLKGLNEYAVTEACEYKKNFLDIKPSVAVITNIDNDHMDSYKGKDDMIRSFRKFVGSSVAVINADDENSKTLINADAITFGIDNDATVMAKNVRKTEKGYYFVLKIYGKSVFSVNMKVLGKFNVYNALATFAVCLYYKIDLSVVKNAIENFSSVERRTEYLGEFHNKKLYADYAHHPNEIKAVLSVFPKNCLTVFQPHTYSRTRNLKKEFIDVLSSCDTVIYKTYPAREKYDRSGDGYSLYLSLKKHSEKKVLYAKNRATLKKIIEKSDADTVAFIGAGDIYFIAKKLFSAK